MPNEQTRRIEVLAYRGAQILDVTGPAQVFASANDLAALGGAPPYEIELVAEEADVETSSHLVLKAAPLPASDRALHTLIVAGGGGVNAACARAPLVEWLRRRSAGAVRTASVCSGAFLLAQAGLLDGRRAVTHWKRCPEFAARFPAVRLDPEPIFLRDGDIWTSAGITAGIDLALAMVEEDLGRKLALAVARQLVVFLKRPGGQAQYSAILALQEGDGRFEKLHDWVAGNLTRDLSLPALADRAGMSLRSFSRLYRQTTGQTPARAVEAIRIEAARILIEDGTTIAQTWRCCGFGSEETLRRIFQRTFGISPQAYRRCVAPTARIASLA
jgi:transcriptional regulator GlxA family with amidase domain